MGIHVAYGALRYRATTRLAEHFHNLRRHPRVKVRVRVGTSRIAGLGLFAGQDIQQGIKIIRYIGEKITQEESERCLVLRFINDVRVMLPP
jgi:hypothetical protein